MRNRVWPDNEPDPEFRAAVADVAPLRHAPRVRHAPRYPHPIARQRQRDQQYVLHEMLHAPLSLDDALDCGDELQFLRNGLPRDTLRRLRRGHWVIQAELDLHGFSTWDAHDQVLAFLAECLARGHRCIRIVHGKGLRSKNREPILKPKLARWLMQRDEILAFSQARGVDGGGGALMVLLRAWSP